MMSPY